MLPGLFDSWLDPRADRKKSGDFEKEWSAEAREGYKELTRMRSDIKSSPINDFTKKMLSKLKDSTDES